MAALAASFTGCAAQMAGQSQLAFELSQARDEAAAQRAHVTELEARLSLLERDATSKRTRASQDAPVLEKLDHLIRVNERLLERASATAPKAAENLSSAPTLSGALEAPEQDVCADGLSPEEQLERLVRRMHGHGGAGFRGGLSLEQSQALRLLLRRERELDANSPWQAW